MNKSQKYLLFIKPTIFRKKIQNIDPKNDS